MNPTLTTFTCQEPFTNIKNTIIIIALIYLGGVTLRNHKTESAVPKKTPDDQSGVLLQMSQWSDIAEPSTYYHSPTPL